MDGCAIDLLCELDSFGFKVVIYVVFSVTLLWFGYQSGKADAYREGFINGVQYYLNIVAYNAAKIPEKIDEDANACIKEAKERLSKHIKPIPPNC
jgi:hypothetical protein